MKNALLLHPDDNVAVVLESVDPGDVLAVNGQMNALTAAESVRLGHKIANCNICAGAEIIKYGHVIGKARVDIFKGDHIHTHNVEDIIQDWPNQPPPVFQEGSAKELPDDLLLHTLPALSGYRRHNGMAGFRNHLLVLSTVVCANQVVQDIGYKFPDLVAITNPSGCIIMPDEAVRIRSTLLSLAMNPNVGAVIFVGLGCETTGAQWYYDQVKNQKPAAFLCEQDEGSSLITAQKLSDLVIKMREKLKAQKREPLTIADIRLGTQCGGSDWSNAIVSNPAIGYASDLVVKNGGISILGETCGWFGGEEALIAQARSREIADDLMHLLHEVYNRASLMGRRIDQGNPSPGNIEGGITTLCEKALGNVKKGGAAPLNGVLAFGEAPEKPGYYVCDNPGLDPVSLLGLSCASANIVLFSTGRGTPIGTPLAPAIKLTGSFEAAAGFGAHMDIDLTAVTRGEMSIEQAGRLLFDTIIEVANGKPVIAEQLGHREYAFPLLMGAL